MVELRCDIVEEFLLETKSRPHSREPHDEASSSRLLQESHKLKRMVDDIQNTLINICFDDSKESAECKADNKLFVSYTWDDGSSQHLAHMFARSMEARREKLKKLKKDDSTLPVGCYSVDRVNGKCPAARKFALVVVRLPYYVHCSLGPFMAFSFRGPHIALQSLIRGIVGNLDGRKRHEGEYLPSNASWRSRGVRDGGVWKRLLLVVGDPDLCLALVFSSHSIASISHQHELGDPTACLKSKARSTSKSQLCYACATSSSNWTSM